MLIIFVYHWVHYKWIEIPFVEDYPLNPKHANEIICQFRKVEHEENYYLTKVL